VTRGRLGIDLFSGTLVWQGRAHPLPFRTREGLATDTESRLLRATSLPEAARSAAHDAVLEWANAWPQAAIDTPADAMSLKGMVRSEEILEAARREVALLERVLDLARLDEPAAARVRAVEVVLVPVRQDASSD
jgi:hypothetical protein